MRFTGSSESMYSGYKCMYVCREEHDAWLHELDYSSYPRKEGQLCFPTHINFINCQHFDYSALKKTVVKMLAVDKN